MPPTLSGPVMSSAVSKLLEFSGKYLRSLGHCTLAFTAGVFTYRGRSLISEVDKIGRTPRDDVPLSIPRLRISELVADSESVRVCEPEGELGNVSMLETVIINRLVKSRQPMACFEIGTFDGRTTLNLAANAPADAVIHTLDLPSRQLERTALPVEDGDRAHIDKPRSGARFLGRDEARGITQLYGDSATFDFEPYAGQIDLVFVDGSHSYQYVMNDTKVALSLLRDGRGVILWHDYGVYPGVTRALNELYAGGDGFRELRHIENTSLVCLLR